MLPLQEKPKESRAEFLARRKNFIGSSDAPGILNLSKFQTPLRIYLSKVGEMPDEDDAPKKWGRMLEDTVAVAYSEEMGRDVIRPQELTTFHPTIPYMAASLDFITFVDGEKRPLETKTSNQPQDWGDSGTDEIPDYYNVQVQHQMAVTGYQVADLAVLINASDFRVFTIKRSEKIIAHLINIERTFWEMVQNRRAPEPDWEHPDTLAVVKQMWALDQNLTVQGGDKEMYQAIELLSLKADMNAAKRRANELQARLLHAMGNASTARLPNGWELRRKVVQRAGYTVDPTIYEKFDVVPTKETVHGQQQIEHSIAGGPAESGESASILPPWIFDSSVSPRSDCEGAA